MRFSIYSVSFDENDGGAVVMHTLCARLRELGYDASMYPWSVADYRRFAGQSWLRAFYDHILIRRLRYRTGTFQNPVSRKLTADTIVVYPEIVLGNPLAAHSVVRWLLYKLEGHHRPIQLNPADFVFYYSADFDSPALTQGDDRLLRVTYISPAYVKTNDGVRHGSCVLFRKGSNRVHDRHPSDATVIDGLSHSEIAAVFNQCERFYSYDLYSFYTVFAAICGCVPVVVPVDGIDADHWVQRIEERWGVAYGDQEIEWAVATRSNLIAYLEQKTAEENRLIRRFIEKCKSRFGK